MDLPNVETYLTPHNLENITNWGEGWVWLAGGTWLFSEPQPHLKVLVDIQDLGWSEIIVEDDYLIIGATCPLIKLLEYPWLSEWTAAEGFKSAIAALAASFKVINMATVGGNICLALSVGTLAPMMVALEAIYEIWNLNGESRRVAAKNFQLGHCQTILKTGEILRRVLIPISNLKWQVNYQRFSVTASEPALAIVVGVRNQQQISCVIGASVVAPCLVEVANDEFLETGLINVLEGVSFIEDARASAIYRREVTAVLMREMLQELKI
ncbi:MAG: FAD binding domain-containing protein [Goleter apudmare HA4340-LM2]|jgi:CO/xanthine dehydrogenase FAD-binding subunit|nr:FAD binding domain-containing protein [Goleter apudmare HA4340-LM2]